MVVWTVDLQLKFCLHLRPLRRVLTYISRRLIPPDLINLTALDETYYVLSFSLCIIHHSALIFIFLAPNIRFSTLFSNVLNLLSAFRVR
jgi:hypothetical protein